MCASSFRPYVSLGLAGERACSLHPYLPRAELMPVTQEIHWINKTKKGIWENNQELIEIKNETSPCNRKKDEIKYIAIK